MRNMINITIRLFFIITFCLVFVLKGSAEAKFMNHFLYRIGGASLSPGDVTDMAKFDIIAAEKFHYDDISGDSWGAIKAINPNVEIYLYTNISYTIPAHDAWDTKNLVDLGRHNVSRGHSMGRLSIENDDFFLLNASGHGVEFVSGGRYLLDFGSSDFRSYSVEATITDHVSQPWSADGVFSDHCWAIKAGVDSTPVRYNTDAKWSAAMNDMCNVTTAGLAAKGQKFFCNRGKTTSAAGYSAWDDLDDMANPPDVVLEEAGFCVEYGKGDVQFWPESSWKRIVDIVGEIHNSSVCVLSHTGLDIGESGTDNYGDPFTFWDALWFALGSFHLAKNSTDDNSFFGFSDYYNDIPWYDEYDSMDGGNLDLGNPTGSYEVKVISGVNVYSREFQHGYVYVNPTPKNVSGISLPEICNELTHNNFKEDLETIPDKNSININAHRAVFLYKRSQVNQKKPNPPQNLRVVSN